MIGLYLGIGIASGILLSYIFFASRQKSKLAEIAGIREQLEWVKAELKKKEDFILQQNQQLEQLHHKEDKLEQDLQSKTEEIQKVKELKNELEKDFIQREAQLTSDKRSLSSKLEELQKIFKEQEDKFLKIEENFKAEFKNMAQEILEEKSQKFAEVGKKDMYALLQPLQENIKHFSKQVKDSYENESRERFNLKEEIRKLNNMNIKLSDQANNLALALKGDSKTQGDWGEMILENMLSDSGLTLGREYLKQETIRDEEGKQLRPDFIIKYPDQRFLIIDSKVSLRAYEAYVAATDVEQRKHFLNQHLKAVWDRVMELSSKAYQDQFDGSPDFVMMFMPIEPAFMLAVQSDASLWNRAYEKRVILMSPTNLVAALKMINELWKHDAQNKNTLAISEAAANLYDKFVGFYEDLNKVSKQMEAVKQSFDQAKGKLSTGRGNLIGRVEKLRELGVKTKKKMDLDQISFHEEDEEIKPNTIENETT
jgi:DNA recombination protein RmuC